MNQNYCTNCVMDISAREFSFDPATGRCNFCLAAEKALQEVASQKWMIDTLLYEIQKAGEGKEYDCLIGLSGGADSSYALYQAVKLGLRPLAFSVDNGWNDPKADENIMRLVEGINDQLRKEAMADADNGEVIPVSRLQGVPFIRYNIDIVKFKELQSAFIQAGVKNIEIPTDHVLMAATYELADRYGIKYVISGGNVATESIMPPSWGYSARDLKHIKSIYKKFIGKDLTGLPVCSLFKFNWYKWVKKIKTFYLLDYLHYNREEAIKTLETAFEYQHPGEKHCESTWTWWFQNYYLFEKFGIDKRKAHLSSLIVSGQMTREEADAIVLSNPIYPEFGIEKKVMKYTKHEHEEYPQDEKLFNFIGKIIKILR